MSAVSTGFFSAASQASKITSMRGRGSFSKIALLAEVVGTCSLAAIQQPPRCAKLLFSARSRPSPLKEAPPSHCYSGVSQQHRHLFRLSTSPILFSTPWLAKEKKSTTIAGHHELFLFFSFSDPCQPFSISKVPLSGITHPEPAIPTLSERN